MPETDIEKLLKKTIESPASGSVDGQSFTSRSVEDIIKADKYLASKKAVSSGKGFRIMRTTGGSVNE